MKIFEKQRYREYACVRCWGCGVGAFIALLRKALVFRQMRGANGCGACPPLLQNRKYWVPCPTQAAWAMCLAVQPRSPAALKFSRKFSERGDMPASAPSPVYPALGPTPSATRSSRIRCRIDPFCSLPADGGLEFGRKNSVPIVTLVR